MQRKILLLVIVVSLLFVVPVYSLELDPPSFELESEAAVLMEPVSGDLIYSKEQHQPLPPASLNKIMTLLLIMEALEEGEVTLQETVVASSHAESMGGSEIWLEVGEEMRLEEMLKAVAISSANDASVALAEHIYGSEELFVQVMNDRADSLGLENSFFGNASGLPIEGQESKITAHDISLLARELLEYPEVLDYTSIWLDYLRDDETELNNTNKLLVSYQGADGLKTGWTDEAGFSVVATAERKGVRMIATVLKAPTSDVRFSEAVELMNYGFGLYRAMEVTRDGQYIQDVYVSRGSREFVGLIAGDSLTVPVLRGKEEQLIKEIKILPQITAPLSEGEKVGEIVVSREDGTQLGSVDLLVEREVPRATFIGLVGQLLKKILGWFISV